MLRLYDFYDLGNGYKVWLLFSMLGIAYDYVEVDILAGETRTPEFLEKNPNGRIPVLEFDEGTCLAESNPILLSRRRHAIVAGRPARARPGPAMDVLRAV
jgi:glutathione S-transferase